MARRKPKARKCPICGRAPVDAFKPFCSRRCVDADLAKWLGGSYAIPGAPAQDESAEESETPKKPQ
jgi:endogenous inhibitor of DNA gyrase (YacG/DUF329 family)